MPEQQDRKWYHSHDNLSRLLEFLIDTDRAELEKKWLVYFLEKPWKWTGEFEEFLKANPEYKP